MIRAHAREVLARAALALKIAIEDVKISITEDEQTRDVKVAFRLSGDLAMEMMSGEVGQKTKGLRLIGALSRAWDKKSATIEHLMFGAKYVRWLQEQVDAEIAAKGTRVLSDEDFAAMMRLKRQT